MKAPFDSRQLRAFVTLARTGSFTRTAKELFLSQSAVSHSVKALEEDVGCRLLDRVGKKVALTPAGEQLLYHTEKILSEMEKARASMEQLEKWGRNRLRIGASATACQYILPNVLKKLQEKFAQCQITIEPGNTPEVLDLLRDNRIDLALALMPKHANQFEFQPLFTDELVFVVTPSHPWAIQGQVVRADISKQNYILYKKASYTFRMVEEYFREEDTALNTIIELGNMEASKELIKIGLGVSILAPWIARKELEEKSLVALPLGKRKLKRTWGIIHRQGGRLNLIQETFIGLCRSEGEEIVTKNGYYH